MHKNKFNVDKNTTSGIDDNLNFIAGCLVEVDKRVEIVDNAMELRLVFEGGNMQMKSKFEQPKLLTNILALYDIY